MINDSSVKERSKASIDNRRFVLTERKGLVADHLVDTNAKSYAIKIRLDGLDDSKITSTTDHSVSKVITKVG